MTPSARPAGGSDPSPPAAGRTGEIAGTADGINAGPTIPPPRTEPAGEHGTGGMDGVAAPPRAVEPAGGEPAGGEPAGGEPAGGEPPRVEPPRVEPPRVEPPRVEPPRVEPPRVEPPRVEPPRVDGRTARSERTRGAIVDAHLELIREGDLRPTADRIAKQAGVSLRALWSHFADMEALFTASGRRVLELRAANHRPVSPDLPLAERIAAYSDQQARLLEEITPTARPLRSRNPSPTFYGTIAGCT